mmetsp:Transcript_43004/g.130918  ORF Transcript_43004/g.130918 Transcript_43004/m.130918 type:complete len:380 (-) Transcript_43004:352-1491(-)
MGVCQSSSSDVETDAELDERERRDREAGQRRLRDLVAKGLLAERQGEGASAGSTGKGVDWDAVIKTADELHRRELSLQRKRDRREKKRGKRRTSFSEVSTNDSCADGSQSTATEHAGGDVQSIGSGSKGGGVSNGWKRARERRLRRQRDALGSFSVNMATYRSNGEVVVLGDRRRREEFVEAERRSAAMVMTVVTKRSTMTKTLHQGGRQKAMPQSDTIDACYPVDEDVPSPPPSPPDFKSPEWSVSTGVTTEVTASTSQSPSNSPTHSHSEDHSHSERHRHMDDGEGVEVEVSGVHPESGNARAGAEAEMQEEKVEIVAEETVSPPPLTSPTGSFEEAISGSLASPSSANARGGGPSGSESNAICPPIREGTMPTILE